MRRSRATAGSMVSKPVSPDQEGKIAGLAVVVMAAGLGKRMCSKQVKVLHPVAGQAMVLYSVGLGLRVAGDRVAVVVGHQADQVRHVIGHAHVGKERRLSGGDCRTTGAIGYGACCLAEPPGLCGGQAGRPIQVFDFERRYAAASGKDRARTPSCA